MDKLPQHMLGIDMIEFQICEFEGSSLSFPPLHKSHRHAYDMFAFGSRHAVKMVSVSEFAGHSCSKW